MRTFVALCSRGAFATLLIALLAWPASVQPGAWSVQGSGYATRGLVVFEVGSGGVSMDLREMAALAPGLDAALKSLDVKEIRPYFVRPARPARTPEEERLSRIYQAEFGASATPEEAARLLLAIPEVVAASPVPMRFVAGLPDDKRFSEQWGFRQSSDIDMDLPEAWDVFRGDSTVVVAVLDTGLDRIHPDMGGVSPVSRGNVWVNAAEASGLDGIDDDSNGYVDDVWGWDWVHYDYVPSEDYLPWPGEDYLDEDSDPSDFHGHGTAVAGVVGAVGNNDRGVAGFMWRCGVMGLRCGLALNTGGPSPYGAVRMDWCARAVAYAADMGAAAINASWESGYDVGLEAAVDYAVSLGVAVSVAAGNRAADPADLAENNYLSSRGDCIDVAAIQQNGRRWSGSNFGAWVDVNAPGSNVLTLKFVYPEFRGYALWSGTSFAAPAVAAAAALVRRDHPGWSAEQVRAHLQLTSVPLSPPDPTIGSGLINAFNAIKPENGGWRLKLGSEIRTALLPVVGPGGVEALAAGLADGRAAAWRPNGEELDSWPVDLSGAPLRGVAAGDLQGDGEPEIVFVDDQGTVSVIALSGSILSSCSAGAPPVGGPVLADLGGDGALEVILCTADSRVHAWSAAGEPVPGWPAVLAGSPAGAPAAGDVDRDNGAEAVVACAGGAVYCLTSDGSSIPGWPVSAGVPLSTSPTLADVAGEDGVPEVVVGGEDGRVYAWGGDGELAEGWPFVVNDGALLKRLSVGDVDGDGSDEAAVVGSDGSLDLFDLRGFEEYGWPLSARLAGSAALMADVDGDSIPDLLATVAGVGIGAWDLNGSKIENWPKPTDGAPLEGILIGDIDADGRPEIIAACAGGGLHCWDLADVAYVSSAAIWPLPERTPGNTRLAALSIPAGTPEGGQGLGDPIPFRVVSLRAVPNPSTAGAIIVIFSELAGPGESKAQCSIRIFDAAGRLVKGIRVPPRSPGAYRDYWDGLSEDGVPVPSGIYFCVAAVEGRVTSFPMVLVR